MPNRALIFDFDGVVLDTETPLYLSWKKIYSRFDARLDLELFAGYIGGAEYFDFHRHLERQIGRELDRPGLMSERRALYRRLVADGDALPGAREYLSEAKRHGLRVGLASNSDMGWVSSNLRHLGLLEEFDALRTRDDVTRGKPDPEIYFAVTRALKTEPRRAIAIEDSASGVAAAEAAGLFTVAVPNPITKHHDLSAADLVIDSLADLPFARLLERAGWDG